jgi:subtilisin family serine protease
MLEIIHDIAPGAQLAVASANTSLEFAQRVNELVNNFGADVVVDDLGFFFEPYFSDGIVAQAVAAVTSQTIYISAAGNYALGHYEVNYLSDYSEGADFHNFGQAAGVPTDISMNVLIYPGQFVVPILQWNDQFGLSANDYDLLLVNEAETDFLCPTCMSAEKQSGIQDPIEGICYFNNTNYPVRGKIVIHRFSGVSKRLEMFVLGGQVEEYNTPDGSVFGHSGVPGALAIGAINASDPGNDNIEPFSSRGPSRIDFPSVQNRPKPDLIAIDGVSVTGTGGFPSVFFGTSAAAPHAAGVAALLKQGAPAATPAMIRTALKSSAVDLGISGQDNIFGSGRINALAAFMVIAPDTDNDGLKDFEEELTYLSDPNESDTDGDGLYDGLEVTYWGIAWNEDPDGDLLINLLDSDSDNDGLSDGVEVLLIGTDPALADSDGNGLSDGEEVQCGSDPLDPNSRCARGLPWLMLLLE